MGPTTSASRDPDRQREEKLGKLVELTANDPELRLVAGMELLERRGVFARGETPEVVQNRHPHILPESAVKTGGRTRVSAAHDF